LQPTCAAAATTVEMAVLLVLIRRRLAGLEGRRMIGSLARTGLASLVMGAVAGGLAWLLEGQSAWLACGVAITVGGVEYVAASVALGAPEPRAVWGLVTSRSRVPE
jgi:peptidoglycan biosynthesis protein MviN/MurJ (putative lipid II flippase)